MYIACKPRSTLLYAVKHRTCLTGKNSKNRGKLFLEMSPWDIFTHFM